MVQLLRSIMPVSTVALLAVDLVLIAGSFLAAQTIAVGGDPLPYVFDRYGWIAILIVTTAIVGGMYFHNLYSQIYIRSRVLLLEQLCVVAGIAFILEGLISYLSADLRLEIGVMLWGGALATTLLFFWRLFFSRYSLEVLGLDRLLLIGDGPLMTALASYTREFPQAGFLAAGQVSREAVGAGFSAAAFHQVVEEAKPNRVIVGARGDRQFAQELVELSFGGSPMEDAATCYERVCGRVSWDSDPLRLLSTEFGASGNTFVFQSLFGFLAALAGLIVLLPFFLAATAAVAVAGGRQHFEKRVCVGRNGRPFTLWRMRAEPGSTAARLIGFCHLNAYLHLWWVLKGDLALVGPRPEPRAYIDALSQWAPYCGLRHSVRPGITGWAQIKNSSDLEDALEVIEYDLYYAKHQSLMLDVVILAQAMKAALFPAGESRQLKS